MSGIGDELGHQIVRRGATPTLTDGWILVSCDALDNGHIQRLVACKDCDGIGVLAVWTWTTAMLGYEVQAIDTEAAMHVGIYDPDEGDEVPLVPPVARP